MSPRLPRITSTELSRALERDGWYVSRQSGSHMIMRHSTKDGRVVVAVHSGAIVKPKTLKSALEKAGLSVDAFRRLL